MRRPVLSIRSMLTVQLEWLQLRNLILHMAVVGMDCCRNPLSAMAL